MRLLVCDEIAQAVSAAEAMSTTPMPRASGGAMRNVTSAATATMTNVRMATVSLISIRDPVKPQPIQNRPPVELSRKREREP